MRIIERDIVGAFIFSKEGNVLLGHNKKGGVYQDMLVVPGGGIDTGETKRAALQREVLEETGIDISDAEITEANDSTGESEKTLQPSGERVHVKMRFFDFKVQLNKKYEDVELRFDDDFASAEWYATDELEEAKIGPATKATLIKLGYTTLNNT